MASPLFFERLRHDLGLELFLKVHLLQAAIFFFQLFHAGHHGDIHAAIFSTLLIESSRTHAKFAANIWNADTRFNPFDCVNDLAVAEF